MHWKKLKDLREQEGKEPEFQPTIVLYLPQSRLRWRPLTYNETRGPSYPFSKQDSEDIDDAVYAECADRRRESNIWHAMQRWLDRFRRLGIETAKHRENLGFDPHPTPQAIRLSIKLGPQVAALAKYYARCECDVCRSTGLGPQPHSLKETHAEHTLACH